MTKFAARKITRGLKKVTKAIIKRYKFCSSCGHRLYKGISHKHGGRYYRY